MFQTRSAPTQILRCNSALANDAFSTFVVLRTCIANQQMKRGRVSRDENVEHKQEYTETLKFNSQCNSKLNLNTFSAETATAKLEVT